MPTTRNIPRWVHFGNLFRNKSQWPVHKNYENLGCMFSNDMVPLIHVYILSCKHFFAPSGSHHLFMVTIRFSLVIGVQNVQVKHQSAVHKCEGIQLLAFMPLLCCMLLLLLTEHLVAKIYGWKMLRRPIFPSSRYINVWQDRLLIFTADYRGGGL